MSHKKFPEFYPQGLTVPHANAESQSFECLYRLADQSPAKQADFKAKCQEPCRPSYIRRNRNNPRFYGTSFSTCKHKLEHLKAAHPDQFGPKLITSGEVEDSLGVSLVEAKHVCVWFYKDCFPTGFTES